MEKSALQSVKCFKESDTPGTEFPLTLNSLEAAFNSVQSCILYEANKALKGPIEPPSNPHLHAVNVDSKPGIVSCNKNKKISIVDEEVNPTIYDWKANRKTSNATIVQPCDNTPPSDKDIQKAIHKNEERSLKQAQKMKKKLEDDDERAQVKEEKNRKKEEQKQLYDEMTKDEKKEYRQQQKEERDQKRAEKEAKRVETLENKTPKVEKRKEKPPEEWDSCSNIVFESKPISRNDLTFYCSPIPFDRHLRALEFTNPSPKLLKTLLKGDVSEHLHIIHGPPGTGKTTKLIECVKEFLMNHNGRAIIVSPTNIGAANMYVKCNNSKIACAISLSQSKIPEDMPMFVKHDDLMGSRVVYCTVAGRNNSSLKFVPFQAVFIDEAGMIPECQYWGLFREEVEHVVMAGDIEQLPGQVSQDGKVLMYDRSMMERLQKLDYPVSFLDTQRRMHPEIVHFPNKYFYKNGLKTEYIGTEEDFPYILYNIPGEEESYQTSFFNAAEVQCINKLYKDDNEIIAITPYTAQNLMLRKLNSDIKVHTVDSFQGKESDKIVLSIVRTNTPGFWADTRRLLVALTRARNKLIIVGNLNSDAWKSDCLNSLKQNAMQRKLIFEVEH
jgi:superfamily I DNA and/or RNA helicase